MIEFGKTLREAREARGLSIRQVADATHMMSSTIEGLESENFSRIPAPIYGRGFIKLYCQAVGIGDPKPLVDEFMEIYNGNRDLNIRERPRPAVPQDAAPAIQNEPEDKDVTPARDIPTFDAVASSEAPTDAFEPVPSEPAPSEPLRSEPALPEWSFSKPSISFPSNTDVQPKTHRADISPAIWRMALLVLGGVAVIAGIVLCVRALYRATAVTAPDEPAIAEPAERKDPAPSPEPTRKPRKLQKVEPLYFD